MVQLTAGHVVAHHVAAVVRKPHFMGVRVPGEAHRIAHAMGKDFLAAAIGVHAGDAGVDGVGLALVADVAGCAHRHVQFAVGPKGDVLPAVVAVGGQFVGHQHRFTGVG